METWLRAGCLLAVFWLASRPAQARDIYVNNLAGDDRFTGAHAGNMPDDTGAVRTLDKALRLAGNGDRIVLAKTTEPYRESIALSGSRHSGTPGQRFILEGSGATLDGSAPIPAKAWEHYRGLVFRCRPSHPNPQQLFLGNRPAPRVFASQITDQPPKLEPLQWCLHRGYLYFAIQPVRLPQEQAVLPEDYALRCAGQPTGITLLQVEWVAIRNLVIQGFQLDGINAHNSARLVLISSVVSRDNGRSGVNVGGASIVELGGCSLTGNGQAQLLTQPYSETHIEESRLLSSSAPGWVDQGGRVWLDGRRIQGGFDQQPPPATQNAAPVKR